MRSCAANWCYATGETVAHVAATPTGPPAGGGRGHTSVGDSCLNSSTARRGSFRPAALSSDTCTSVCEVYGWPRCCGSAPSVLPCAVADIRIQASAHQRHHVGHPSAPVGSRKRYDGRSAITDGRERVADCLDQCLSQASVATLRLRPLDAQAAARRAAPIPHFAPELMVPSH